MQRARPDESVAKLVAMLVDVRRFRFLARFELGFRKMAVDDFAKERSPRVLGTIEARFARELEADLPVPDPHDRAIDRAMLPKMQLEPIPHRGFERRRDHCPGAADVEKLHVVSCAAFADLRLLAYERIAPLQPSVGLAGLLAAHADREQLVGTRALGTLRAN